MDLQEAFAELGLSRPTNHADAKVAYRSLAMHWHPDTNGSPHAGARMKLINVAYALVCRHLDAHPHATATATAADPRPAQPAARSQSGFTEYDWKRGFSAPASGCNSTRSVLVQRSVQVSLFEAAFGCVKRLSGMESDTCVRCAGSGEYPGDWTLGARCMQCFGSGLHGAGGGLETAERPLRCVACQGSGVFKPEPPQCTLCRGSGKAERKCWTVDVHIHAGALDCAEVAASDIRLRSSLNGMIKKFKLTVQIEKSPIFRLDHDRLSVVVPVSLLRWVLGGEMTVPTLDGTIRVALPDRPTGLWVQGQGWPQFGKPNQRQPLFVLPKMVFPADLQGEERHMLQALDARCKLPEVEGWNRSVKAWRESAA
jgi:molecular chaperone DnaJ